MLVSVMLRLARWLVASPRAFSVTLATSIVGLVTAVSFWVPTPYQMLLPGPVTDTNTLIDPPPQQTQGAFYLTSIYSDPASVAEWVYAQAHPAAGLIPREQARPQHLSRKEYRQLLDKMMNHSKMAARVVAFRAAGLDVPVAGQGAVIREVLTNGPVEDLLMTNDVIMAADGRPVATMGDLIAVIRAHHPGDQLSLGVRRDDSILSISVVLGSSSDGAGRARMGVMIATHRVRYSFPRELKIESENLGGPSAGLMFALAIYNSLTPGDLTRGHSIAGTGSIATSGQVGAVGGVSYKVRSAENAGANYFLVPTENADEALRAARTIRVVPVNSFAEALPYIQALPMAGDDATFPG